MAKSTTQEREVAGWSAKKLARFLALPEGHAEFGERAVRTAAFKEAKKRLDRGDLPEKFRVSLARVAV